MKSKLDKSLELILFSLLTIFPFSFKEINIKWNIIFLLVISFLVLNVYFKGYIRIGKPGLSTFFSVLFLVLFDFSENVNFGQLFNIQNNLSWRVPLSTIILSIALIIFTIKILYEKRLTIEISGFIKYFMISCTFLIVLTILFYPFLYHHYQMDLDSNLQLLNKIIKYLVLLVLIFSYTTNEKHFLWLNTGFVISIGLGILLHITI